MYDIEYYYEAESIADALALMSDHPEAKLIAGGSDVLIRIREGKMAGCTLIGIGGIKELSGVELKDNGDLWIGAATTFSHLTGDALIQKYIPVLGEAVDQVGGPQVRNIGTIGGNICNGAVSADSAPTIFSLDALLRLRTPLGERIVSPEEFYLGPGKVDLKPGELLTHIIIPRENYQGYTGFYTKYAMRKAMDISTLSCSIVCKTDQDAKILEDVKITFGVAAPVPLRCKMTESRLRGLPIGSELYDTVKELVRQEINPRDSWRASKAFRLQIGGEIAAQTLKTAIERGERA